MTELYRTRDVLIAPGTQLRITGPDGRVVFVYAASTGHTRTCGDLRERARHAWARVARAGYRVAQRLRGRNWEDDYYG